MDKPDNPRLWYQLIRTTPTRDDDPKPTLKINPKILHECVETATCCLAKEEPWYGEDPQTGMEIRLISQIRTPREIRISSEKFLLELKKNTQEISYE